MTRTPIYLALGLALATLSGCIDDGGPNYVESRLVNEGPVGSRGYRPAPVYRNAPVYEPAPVYRTAPTYRSTVVIDSGPRYPNRGGYREPVYGDPAYRDPAYRDPYYDRRPNDRFDPRRYCSSPRGYDDPRCD